MKKKCLQSFVKKTLNFHFIKSPTIQNLVEKNINHNSNCEKVLELQLNKPDLFGVLFDLQCLPSIGFSVLAEGGIVILTFVHLISLRLDHFSNSLYIKLCQFLNISPMERWLSFPSLSRGQTCNCFN